ncbi:unnamed protein product [Auanema sp. JU1783]|nr:unnamed protein product [Auanema sp. JU1783]
MLSCLVSVFLFLSCFPLIQANSIDEIKFYNFSSALEKLEQLNNNTRRIMGGIGPWSCTYDCFKSSPYYDPDEEDLCVEWKVLTMRNRKKNCTNIIPMSWIKNRTVEVIRSMYVHGPREMYDELFKIGIFKPEEEPFYRKMERYGILIYIVSLSSLLLISLAIANYTKKFLIKLNLIASSEYRPSQVGNVTYKGHENEGEQIEMM